MENPPFMDRICRNRRFSIYIYTGWWLTYPSEKYEFVSWDDDIPNIWKNKIHVPNHQPAVSMFTSGESSFLGHPLARTSNVERRPGSVEASKGWLKSFPGRHRRRRPRWCKTCFVWIILVNQLDKTMVTMLHRILDIHCYMYWISVCTSILYHNYLMCFFG